MVDPIVEQLEIHSRITRIVENLKKKGRSNINAGLIEARIKMLEMMWAKFEATHKLILSNSKPEVQFSKYFKEDQYGETQEAFMDQMGLLMSMLKEETDANAKSTAGASTPSTQLAETHSHVKVPQINLPSFSGQFTEWMTFHDTFHSLIISDPSFKDVERMHYLKGCLKSEAASLVANIPITGENFKRAWDALKERYENRRLQVRSQLQALYNLPPLNRESAADLKRLLYSVCQVVGALQCMGRANKYQDWEVFLTCERMDRQSRREWEARLGASTEPPSLEELKSFLQARINTIEALEEQQGDRVRESKKTTSRPHKVHQVTSESRTKQRCGLCQANHRLLFCPRYSQKSPAERYEIVTTLRQCLNCLGRHLVSECPSPKRCQRCSEKHHTSLHPISSDSLQRVVQQVSQATVSVDRVLLGTALVKAVADNGSYLLVRALIDPGSEVSLISEGLAQRLGLQRRRTEMSLIGIGGRTRCSRGVVQLSIQPHHDVSPTYPVTALVLPHLSANKPPLYEDKGWSYLKDLTLADPNYAKAQRVELLLGAKTYGRILKEGVKLSDQCGPAAQETGLGWILTGSISDDLSESGSCGTATSFQCSVDRELLSLVERFWRQEEPPITRTLSKEELECEEHFKRTHRRTAEGRFVVRLPFKTFPTLGDTRSAAASMMKKMESKFHREPAFSAAYKEFMREYQQLGHMTVTRTAKDSHAYLPHHGVMKEASTTTKLRVVFNGSWKSSLGKSLNDHLHAGPNLLPALADVLTRWRQHRVSFTADVEKMYRQIFVHYDDQEFQRILWRASEEDTMREYRLSTVTYGLTCAPYLAIRCLLQIADEGDAHHPRGARVIREDIYVDDVLSGAATVEEARLIKAEVCTLLTAGGFRLRKWATNTPTVLTAEENDNVMTPLNWEAEAAHSVLGIRWLPGEDCFVVSTGKLKLQSRLTKRTILSTVAQIFDPLGWLAPVTVWTKIFLQALWALKLDWDEALPKEKEHQWLSFVQQLPELNSVRVERWLGLTPSCKKIELHGFADASERAYAAVTYLRCTDEDGKPRLQLVASKTRVAPLKTISLPRLELCAAQLATRLTAHIREVLHLQEATINMWSDSTVTLAWIEGHPSRWQTYVANRVADIQRTLPKAKWHHVSSTLNPADCASRGLKPKEFTDLALWWTSPTWLLTATESCNTPRQMSDQMSDEAALSLLTQVEPETEVSLLIRRFSSLKRLLRVTAWCCRWLQPKKGDREMYLTALELSSAANRWLRLVQAEAFPREVQALRAKENIPAKSRLRRLNPFLDEDSIPRVGGRLQHSLLNQDGKHPRNVPPESPLAALLVDEAHRRCLHGGTQLTLTTLRLRHWILRGRQLVKGCISKCITCTRWRHSTPTQLMGSLPAARVNPGRVFNKVGLDYAGPIHLRTARGRGHQAYKGYICLFICLATRAVHLEVVSDGSTDAFMAALNRFVARRGICEEIWSDCGTAFIGADRELRALLPGVSKRNDKFLTLISDRGIRWRFNPPGAPHFGGIWEAAVKSTKHHLRRVIGEATLTYEEMATLLAGIEACLNSRPLQSLSDDPDELDVLMPAHFLIGEPLTAVPEPSLEEIPVSRLSRWQLLSQMRQHFWRRWSHEYLKTLQNRNKWHTPQKNVKVGDVCLLRNELLPPGRWPLARVTQVHPGTDGVVRVVSLKTAKSEFKRPLTKLVLLPSVTNDAEISTGTNIDTCS